MNHMEEVAKLFGVKMGERFMVGDEKYYIAKEGLMDDGGGHCPWTLTYLLTGENTIKKIPWKPKNGEIYFQACIKGRVVRCKWFGDVCDLESYYVGNCFETEEEAEAHKREIIDKLRGKYEEDRS